MRKILVVDDEESIRLLYKEELEDEGYEVAVAADGMEALEKFQLFQPDLVTLDLKMPGMDGLEVLQKIRKVDMDIPIVLLTAYSEFKQDFTTWASNAYIVKSMDLSELKVTIKEFLEIE
ncbi:MAG: response regulator [Deltaproteobacteria bacterium]|nr:response regulator [Deltaproteobacteria bacterium]NIS78324.1 response regulator [Deltaproteobacteria bacterium]